MKCKQETYAFWILFLQNVVEVRVYTSFILALCISWVL